LFLDGAVDPDPCTESGFKGGIGGCLLDPSSRSYTYVGCFVPQAFLRKWGSTGAKQVIAQGEFLPALVARCLFSKELAGKPVLCFIDNESARNALIKGSSPCALSAEIVEAVINQDLVDQALLWYSRVPSPSNLADDPSRGRPPEPLRDWNAPLERKVNWALIPYG